MIAQADLDAIIVDKMCAAQLPAVLSEVPAPPPLPRPNLMTRRSAAFMRRSSGNSKRTRAHGWRRCLRCTEDIAYLLFTSGSTGTPKEIPYWHGNALYFMQVMSERYGLDTGGQVVANIRSDVLICLFSISLHGLEQRRVFVFADAVELLAPDGVHQ